MKAYLEGTPVSCSYMETQADRVRKLMRARGVADREIRPRLADVCDIKYQSVKGWFDGSTKTIQANNLSKIATHWGANLDWLVSGKGSMDAQPGNVVAEPAGPYGTGSISRRAPIIQFDDIGKWMGEQSAMNSQNNNETHPAPNEAGESAFWTRVTNDSMIGQAGLSFPAGTLVLVDPDYPADPGRMVVARQAGTGQVTFKQLVEDAGKLFLKPLNHHYPMIQIDDQWEIIGAVRKAEINL